MGKGFICIATLDRFDELKRFLYFFKKFNSLPISILLASNIEEAHHLKTNCAFYSPFDYTCFLDIDILVNGDLSGIFDLVPCDKIGIVREKGVKCLNSGVLVFDKLAGMSLCESWSWKFANHVKEFKKHLKGTWDQKPLNDIIKKFPYVELPFIWNCILKDRSPEEELKIYDQVKIFHFLHAPDIDRNKYKSYQTFMSV